MKVTLKKFLMFLVFCKLIFEIMAKNQLKIVFIITFFSAVFNINLIPFFRRFSVFFYKFSLILRKNNTIQLVFLVYQAQFTIIKAKLYINSNHF